MELKIIARLHGDFPDKFGLPRQSGLTHTRGIIVFEKPYRVREAVRGIEEFSHLWLLWGFDRIRQDTWSPTVRPPKLGGNRRTGVFATRSPFRPNPIGLTLVELLGVQETGEGLVLLVSGADMADGTPIYDIKPYLPYTEALPQARGGFSDAHRGDHLTVIFPDELKKNVPEEKLDALIEALACDPRPAYIEDGERIYGFAYAGREVRFSVSGGTLTVRDILPE